jgi:hypothetical protein
LLVHGPCKRSWRDALAGIPSLLVRVDADRDALDEREPRRGIDTEGLEGSGPLATDGNVLVI